MKYKYLTRAGHQLEADTPQALLEQMRDSSPFTASEPLDSYLQAVAERELTYSGQQLDTRSLDAFIATAAASGLLTAQ